MYVIILLLANVAGSPVAAGQFDMQYETLELCEAARPDIVSKLQRSVFEHLIKTELESCMSIMTMLQEKFAVFYATVTTMV